MKPLLPALFLAFIACLACRSSAATAPATMVDCIDIARVWSAHPVGFTLLTRAPFQFVAFYNDRRQLTVAQRRLDGRVTISYHKHDAAGNTQPWTARLEGGGWKFHQITDWPWRWDFGGGGSLPFDISIGPVTRESDGRLTQTYSHAEFGGGTWLLDPVTLRSTGRIDRRATPPALGRIEGKFPGLKVRTAGDSGTSDKPGIRYMLRWETLEPIRDKPRAKPWPKPSMLRLYVVKP